ncbi:MAG: hypothetical protein ABIR71_00825 [Chthoniobacterales bacterium]
MREDGAEESPTRLRLLVATIVVVLTVLAVWKFIDSRSEPPPPPAPIPASTR